MNRNRIDILGVQIDALTMSQALKKAEELARDRKAHYIVTPNPEFVMQSLKDGHFREVVNGADLALADGIGILWAAKFLSIPLSRVAWWARVQAWMQLFIIGVGVVIYPKWLTSVVPERITGVDMLWEISKLASEKNLSIFLLGAAPGVAYEVSRKLQMLYPRLQIAEVMAGPPYEPEAEVLDRIKQVKPHFIFLAFPATEQLRWMRQYTHQLNRGVLMGIGGAFDFIVGATSINDPTKGAKAVRAPQFLQRRGLEWVWRYLTQPWRKDRIKTATIEFMRTVLEYKLARH
ncbi:WecB/TagA/CpsF family glycosyltransferase [Patescibacteria group bacterium]|nr:WecB/TagA/CpsF family glycosyltransferase [Patescibacteria group bacterium]